MESESLLQYFDYAHVPLVLADVSRPFCELARWLVNAVPRNAERCVVLRKLLEAKDCAVRARVYQIYEGAEAGLLPNRSSFDDDVMPRAGSAP
jgi:hypothetical protein